MSKQVDVLEKVKELIGDVLDEDCQCNGAEEGTPCSVCDWGMKINERLDKLEMSKVDVSEAVKQLHESVFCLDVRVFDKAVEPILTNLITTERARWERETAIKQEDSKALSNGVTEHAHGLIENGKKSERARIREAVDKLRRGCECGACEGGFCGTADKAFKVVLASIDSKPTKREKED